MVQGTSSQISRSHIADRGSRYGPPDRWEEGVGEGHPNQRAPNAWLCLHGSASPWCPPDELASLDTGDQRPQHAKTSSDQAGAIPFVTKANSILSLDARTRGTATVAS